MKLVGMTPEVIYQKIEEMHPEVREVENRVRSRVTWNKRAVAPYQAAALYALAKEYGGERILEIGTALGISAAFMAEGAPNAKITTLNPKEHEAAQARKSLAAYPNVTVVEAKSWDYLRKYPKKSPKFDMIFVDGDHKRVRMDIPWWDFLNEGGLMVFHDYSPEGTYRPSPPVYAAINEMADILDQEIDVLIVDHGDVGMAGFVRRDTDPLHSKESGLLVTAQQYSTCTFDYLRGLYPLARQVRDLPGCIVECGVQNGGSAAVLGVGAKKPSRKTWLFDSWQGNPKPGPEDGEKAMRKYEAGGWAVGDRKRVRELMKKLNVYNVKYVGGWFAETIKANCGSCQNVGDIALLHVDATLYASTKLCLEHFYYDMVPGGLVIVGAYGHWPGVRRAVDEFRGSKQVIMPVGLNGVYWRVPDSRKK